MASTDNSENTASVMSGEFVPPKGKKVRKASESKTKQNAKSVQAVAESKSSFPVKDSDVSSEKTTDQSFAADESGSKLVDPLSTSQLILAPNDPLDSSRLMGDDSAPFAVKDLSKDGSKTRVANSRRSASNKKDLCVVLSTDQPAVEVKALPVISPAVPISSSKRTRSSILKELDSIPEDSQEVSIFKSKGSAAVVMDVKVSRSGGRKSRSSVESQAVDDMKQGDEAVVAVTQAKNNKKKPNESRLEIGLDCIQEEDHKIDSDSKSIKENRRTRKSIAVVDHLSEVPEKITNDISVAMPTRRNTRLSSVPLDSTLSPAASVAQCSDLGKVEQAKHFSDNTKSGLARENEGKAHETSKVSNKRKSIAAVRGAEMIDDAEAKPWKSLRARKSLSSDVQPERSFDAKDSVEISGTGESEKPEPSLVKPISRRSRKCLEPALGLNISKLESSVPEENEGSSKASKRRKIETKPVADVEASVEADSSRSILKKRSLRTSTPSVKFGDDHAGSDSLPSKKARRGDTVHVSIGATTEYAITPRKSSQVNLSDNDD